VALQECTVEVGHPSALATVEVPPSLLMMSDAVIKTGITENRKSAQGDFANCVIYPFAAVGQIRNVLDTQELLRLLNERKIPNGEIARALNLNPSRITELKKGERRLLLDEAVKLVQAFELEPAPQASPIPHSIMRLVVRHVADRLRCPLEEPLLEDVAEDLRAFSEFAASPRVRRSIDAAEAFFAAMRLRRPEVEQEAPTESDPQQTG
jgi:hypothetical protein